MAGPAGISADAIKVFEGINGTLLAAAGSLVLLLLIIIYRSPVFWIFALLAGGSPSSRPARAATPSPRWA